MFLFLLPSFLGFALAWLVIIPMWRSWDSLKQRVDALENRLNYAAFPAMPTEESK
jgi:hypothetical protein